MSGVSCLDKFEPGCDMTSNIQRYRLKSYFVSSVTTFGKFGKRTKTIKLPYFQKGLLTTASFLFISHISPTLSLFTKDPTIKITFSSWSVFNSSGSWTLTYCVVCQAGKWRHQLTTRAVSIFNLNPSPLHCVEVCVSRFCRVLQSDLTNCSEVDTWPTVTALSGV